MIKTIFVNFNNLESIKKAERQKNKLENLGYSQKEMCPIGYDKFKLIYKKEI